MRNLIIKGEEKINLILQIVIVQLK